MNNLFEQSRSHWVRYDHYELKTAEDGKRYITPGKNAKPDVYNPLKEVPNIVLDALNVGMLMMGRKPEAEVEKAVMEFVTRYGLLGLMTALPTTPSFMDYEAVYLPKNRFIKEESMATDKYLSLFYPFDQLDLVKKGITSTWNVSGDRTMVALTMTFMDEPMAKNMSFQREYAEPYDWVASSSRTGHSPCLPQSCTTKIMILLMRTRGSCIARPWLRSAESPPATTSSCWISPPFTGIFTPCCWVFR